MADNKEVLLRLKVDGDSALRAVQEYTEKVKLLKEAQATMKDEMAEIEKAQKELNEAYKEGKVTQEDYDKAIEKLGEQYKELTEAQAVNNAELGNESQTLRGYQKELQNVMKQQESLANGSEGSLASLRAELSNATKAFDNLSRAEREGAKGKELLDHINELTDEIKDAEEATQRYYRNVGNYKSALEDADKAMGGMKNGIMGFITMGNPMAEMLLRTSQQLGSVKQAFAVARQGAVMLGKQMLALIATPIGAFLTIVATLLMALKKGLESSEDRMNRFKVVTAPLKGLLDGLSNALGVVCDVLLTFVEYQQKAVDWMLKLAEALPLVGDLFKKGNEARKEYIEIEKQAQEITKKLREEVVETARRENEVSELRAKVAEKDKYTNQERLAFLDKAIALEKEQAQKNLEIAKMKLDNLKREAELSDNDAEMNDKLADAQAEVYRQATALNNKMRELNAQRVEAVNAIKAEAEATKKAAEDKKKEAEREAKERARAAAQAYKEAQQRRKEAQSKEQQALRDAEDALLNIIHDNINKQKVVLKLEHTRQVEDIKKRLATEANLTEKARNALNSKLVSLEIKYQQDLIKIDSDARKAKEQAEAEAKKTASENKRKEQEEQIKEQATALATQLAEAQLKIDNEKALQAELLRIKIQAKQDELMTMQQMEGESDEEYKLRRLEGANELRAMRKQQADQEVAIEQEAAKKKREAYNSVMQAMTAMGEHSKALGKVAKIMGLAQIAVDTGKAISAGVAQAAAAGPFPANLAAIATTVATVLANMATALSTIKSAKFATGGLVEGAGSGTSDSIPARLSNGESVMTAQATSAFAPLLSTLNQMGGGVPINVTNVGNQQMGEDMLARAVARGVASVRPVVSVEEINRVSNNVQVIESLATL